MQAIFLAAGRGVRLRPLTYHVPKPLIKINKECSLDYNIDKLPAEIDELIFVIGYLGEQLKNYFGNEYKGKKIKYVKQNKLLGTGHALGLCKDLLKDRFLVLMGDDLYSSEDIKECLKFEQSMLVNEVRGKFVGGRIKLDSKGCLSDIIEGTHNRKSSLVNTGLYVISKKFFSYDLVPLAGKKEYGLPQTLVKLAKDYPVNIVKASFWLQISDLAGLEKAKKILKNKDKN